MVQASGPMGLQPVAPPGRAALPRLVPIAELPLSQIVLWWVGMLATAHVVVLARLARGARS